MCGSAKAAFFVPCTIPCTNKRAEVITSMPASHKNDSQNAQEFSKLIIDRAIKTLGVKPLDQHVRPDGSVTTVEEEIRQRLNSIKTLFNRPEHFNNSVAPAKIRKAIIEQQNKISDALDVLRSLSGPIGPTTKTSMQSNLVRMWLYEVSEANPAISARLVGHDVVAFDKNFPVAIQSLEKIDGYFSAVLMREEVVVKGRGERKPENYYVDNLLGFLCQLYKDITGESPIAWNDDIAGNVKGRVVGFLQVILREMPYPNKTTLTALEKRIRGLKSHKTYAHLWNDAKK